MAWRVESADTVFISFPFIKKLCERVKRYRHKWRDTLKEDSLTHQFQKTSSFPRFFFSFSLYFLQGFSLYNSQFGIWGKLWLMELSWVELSVPSSVYHNSRSWHHSKKKSQAVFPFTLRLYLFTYPCIFSICNSKLAFVIVFNLVQFKKIESKIIGISLIEKMSNHIWSIYVHIVRLRINISRVSI